jgi:linoleoyl-CoA desaturase
MIRYKFSKEINQEFSLTLRNRVNAYFKENAISRKANAPMITKTVMALGMYIIPFLFVLFGGFTNIPLLFALWIIMGFGKSFIGTSVMHDALHGSYSQKPFINILMGVSTWLIGIDARIWKVQHNVLHHTYTNIEHADDDIAPRYVLRFTPHQPRKWFHRYQHIYVLFFYGISTVVWVTVKDFVKIFKYRNRGLLKGGSHFTKHLLTLILRKVFYLTLFVAVPVMVLPIAPWITILMFVSMHFVAGVALSLIFQPAHVVESSLFIEQDEEEIDESWWVHQVMTTSNFATGSKIFSWFVGGLNYQIEHHLFPDVCHVHYPNISEIVKNTALEYNVPYHAQGSFIKAVGNHFRILRELGKGNTLSVSR